MDMQDSCEFVCLLGLGLVLLLGMAKAAPSGRTNRTDDNARLIFDTHTLGALARCSHFAKISK
jgi:hypothetical protein